MALTTQETEDLLAILASLDSHHTVTSKEKLAAKAYAWAQILEDCEFAYCKQALLNYYRDTNAKSITPALLRMMARKAVPKEPQDRLSPADAQSKERACNARNCPCPHTKCWNGWLDEEETIVNRFGSYPAVKRCPTCKEAKEMESL